MVQFWPLDKRCSKIALTHCGYVDTNFPCTLNGVNIEIMHNVAPVNLYSSINVTEV